MQNELSRKIPKRIPEEITRIFNFELNDTQIETINRILKFIESQDNIFILKGYAGTGKTTLLKGLTKYFNACNTSFICLAPTGRAAKVITEITGCNAHTIHKHIYSRSDLREYKVDNGHGSEFIKYYYSIRKNDDPAEVIYIVDEASMISNLNANGSYIRFGSGFLLNDFLSYVGFMNKRKIIFIGDPAQLPPVNMDNSPALSKNYLEDLLPSQKVQEYEMKEVVRQCKESGILSMATTIREKIDNKIFPHLNVIINECDILSISSIKVAQKYLELTNNLRHFHAVIIAHTNHAVLTYNQAVRERLWGVGKDICPGDRIIVIQNNYSHEIELLNGEFGTIIKVEPRIESRKITVRNKSKITEVVLNFREVVIGFETEDGNIKNISCKILTNLLNSNMPNLTLEEIQALYIDFKLRHPELKPNTADFKNAIEHDPYFNCLRIKYGYAVTCHKAQGGEWEQVLIDFNAACNFNDLFYYRWAYTALTRAKKVVYSIDTKLLISYNQISFKKESLC